MFSGSSARPSPSVRSSPGRPRATGPTLAGAVEALDRCVRFLDALEASPEAPSLRARSLPHLRHCAEHFECFLEGLPEGVVDYAARRRDPALERDPALLRRRLLALREELGEACAGLEDVRLRVRDVVAPARPAEVASGLERELAYLASHAIHHVALLEEVFAPESGGERLGLAFSTAAALRAAGTDEP